MKTEHTIILEDGRTLGYADYGDPDGFPIFYFHGGQESRLSSGFMDSTATALNLRIIAPDRPGIGLSTFQENRALLELGQRRLRFGRLPGIEKVFHLWAFRGCPPCIGLCPYHSGPDSTCLRNIRDGPTSLQGPSQGHVVPRKVDPLVCRSQKR